jgi:hypothetical protein
MTDYDIRFEIYKNYRDGYHAIEYYLNITDERLKRGWSQFMEIQYNLNNSKEELKVVPIKEKIEVLEEIDRLTKEKNTLVDSLNTLKKECEVYLSTYKNSPPIPVPDNGQYEIKNGLLGAKRDVLLKNIRNPRLTDDDLQNIMGMSPRTVKYTDHYLFTNRNNKKPYKEIKPKSDTYPYPDP